MELISRRKWLNSKSRSPSSDCVFSAAPSSSLGSEIPEAALATPACNSQVEHLQTSTLDDSKASPRFSLIAKKGKRESAEGQSVPTECIGLHLIHQLPQAEVDKISLEKQCPIDIVAVHGIMGGAYRTWEHSNGHLWLRDSLPEEVPGARIFSYGYPANVFLSHEKGRIDDHATSLLEELRDVRRNPEEQKRPIVFICHSMGGIVVKKAINITVVNAKRFSNIRTSTAAIFFLATPHCGSDPAKMLSVCGDILNLSLTGFSRFTGKVRSDMIKALAHGSTTLLDISNDFKEHPGNMRIFSFIEQKSTPPSSGKIVDDMSGRMFVAGEVPVPMQGCNHREVARFESKNSNGYRKIVNKLNEVTSEITNKRTAELEAEDLACLASLTFQSVSHRLSSLSSGQQDTCSWILSHPSFLAWSQSHPRTPSSSTTNNMLYIKGHPGTGKSTLMSFIHRFYLQQAIQHGQILLSFFFHGNGDMLQKSQAGMFRSLLIQLYKQSLSARGAILRAYKGKEGAREGGVLWTIDDLQNLFLEIMLSEGTGENETVILVDALDEAVNEGEKGAIQLLRFFHGLNQAIVSKGRKAKICLSCRQYPVLAVDRGELQISIQSENRRDIERYVSSQLSLLVQDWSLQPPRLRSELERAIADKADGVFLWVVKRLSRIVEDLNDGVTSLDDFKTLIGEESNELYVLYEDILERDVKRGVWGKALLFMQWICLSERPLSLTEIRMAIACDEMYMTEDQVSIQDSKEYVESDERMEKLIGSLSGGLAEVRHGVVQLFHQSVADFLREKGIRTLFSGTIDSDLADWTDEQILGTSQDRLSKSCFRYLGLGEVGKIPVWASGMLVQKYQEVEKQFPFIRYATAFAFVHAERAEALGRSQEYLLEQLEPPGAQDEIRYDPEEMIGCSPSVFETWKIVFSEIDRTEWRYPEVGSRLIHAAACFNLRSVIRRAVEKGFPVDQRDFRERTPLHFSAQLGNEQTTLLLLASGADIESEDQTGRTPLAYAVVNGEDAVARALIKRGAKVNIGDGQCSTLLEAACNVKGSMALIKDLVDHGATIDGQIEATSTALQEVAYAGNEEAVRYLISKGADLNAKGSERGSALQAAVQAPDPQRGRITRLLLDRKADVNAQGGEFGSALQAAARLPGRDNTSIMMMLLNEGADVNAQGGTFGTALQAACTTSNIDSVKLLIAMGANVKIKGGKFETALQAAARFNLDAVPLLLRQGADVNAEGGYYGSALQAAALTHDVDRVQLLLEHGAKFDIKGGVHGSVLQAAAWSGSKEITTIFLNLGADINEQGGNEGSALQAAIPFCPESFIKFLLDRGADMNLQGGGEGNALRAALVWPREAVIKLLLERGADIHACLPGKYESALQLAIGRGDLKIIGLLLDCAKNINPKDEWYKQALQRARHRGKEQIEELLLQWKVRAELLTT